MTEHVMEFLKEFLPVMIGIGSGLGFLLGGFSAVLGYALFKVQTFFEIQ